MSKKATILHKAAAVLLLSTASLSPSFAAHGEDKGPADVTPDVTYTLRTAIADGALHDIAFPAFGADSDDIGGKGAATAIVFRATKSGTFEYLCTLPGHKAAGMFGKLIVGQQAAAQAKSTAADISQDPYGVGTPVGKRGPQKITVDLETAEIEGHLADGTTYKYWTFNDKVPGPFIRVRAHLLRRRRS